ncbi:tRNA 2-thiocytidine(32) synthetase TtcA [Myxococcota bacterium]|nr:tRNA 2-thiocytidine(32) synthetase TtcA [Myxococcota bacterium]
MSGSPEHRSLEKKLIDRVMKTSVSYELLAPDDRVLVAVSGGKDSYSMLSLLRAIARRVPFRMSLVAVHLDQRQPGYDGTKLVDYLRGLDDVEFEVLSEDTYSVVLDHVEEGGTYCSLCSRLRRGILYSAAARLGCTKIALGHHRDDSLETFLMNLFYAGKLQAMPAKYRTNDGRFEVIRPMIECAEKDIARFAELEGYPIIPCNLCGSQPGLVRDQMTALLEKLEEASPNVRQVMLNALRNVRPTHLLDQDVLAAWKARDPSIRPDAEPEEREAHAPALPIASSAKSRLRVL